MVFRKQVNEKGDYVDKNGVRFDVLTCERTESKEWVQTGIDTQIIDGRTVEVPVMELQLFINKGWDSFHSKEEAMSAYNLEYKPLSDKEKLDIIKPEE